MRRGSAATRSGRRQRPLVIGPAGHWSNPVTWGGIIPSGGEDLIISTPVVWDCDTQELGNVTITSTVTIDPSKSINMRAKSITVAPTGAFLIGTPEQPYANKAIITLTGKRADAATAVRYVVDYEGRTGAGNGEIKRVSSGSGASAAEDFTVTWSSATAFAVSGSVSGALGSGTVGTIFNNKVRFLAVAGSTAWAAGNSVTLKSVARGFVNNGLPRSFQIQPGGKVRFFGAAPAYVRTKIDAHLDAGQQSMQFIDAIGWSKLNKIVVGPSDFYGTAQGTSQALYLKSKSAGSGISVAGGMDAARWGLMQYVTDAGMSLTPGVLTNSEGLTTEEWALVPKILDERAPVINLTRNIVIQGVDDSDWQTHGFGAHCMFMGLSSEVQFDGVEFRRMGQAGVIGRYAFHWHMLSYNMPDGMNLPSDGTFIGAADPAKHFIRNCSIHQSAQRAIVIHGTHGVSVTRNVIYDIRAHAIFLEDGAEKNNAITDNVVMKVRAPAPANKLLNHDDGSGIWYSNPVNTLSGNWVGDTEGNGIWNVFAPRCFGLCYDVAENANRSNVTLHDANATFTAGVRGMMTELPPFNNIGDTAGLMYMGDFSEANGYIGTKESMIFSRHTNYKSEGYQNRTAMPFYKFWTQADNWNNPDFFGAAGMPFVKGEAAGCLIVGESLNNATSRKEHRRGFASYHEGLNFNSGLVVNYPLLPRSVSVQGSIPIGGGMISLNDLYLGGIFRFQLNYKQKLINSHAGTFIPSPAFDGAPITGIQDGTGKTFHRNNAFCGAFYDIANLWKGGAGRYVVFNHPFYTHALPESTALADETTVSTATPYYGLSVVSVDGIVRTPYDTFVETMQVDRLNAGGSVVASQYLAARDGTGATVDANTAHLRPLTIMKGGKYKITFPDVTSANWRTIGFEAASTSEDWTIIAIQWAGATPVANAWRRAVATDYPSLTSPSLPSAGDISSGAVAMMASAGGMAALEASSVAAYWQDTSNNLVWIKYIGGGISNSEWTASLEEDVRYKKRVTVTIKA